MTLDRRNSQYFSVDRVEGALAVLVADDAASYDVPRSALPKPLREGDILLVGVNAAGVPDWSSAIPDQAERARRLANAQATLDRLRQRDPGGDITL